MHVYFRGLKFVRFIAASLVVVHHTEQFKSIFSVSNLWTNEIIRNLGDRGVTMFFVLSGFLITFLLLKEKERTGTIHIKYFYLRRVLRIWPLYFLVVLTSLFILPEIDFFRMPETGIIEKNRAEIFLLTLAILPNVTLFIYGAVPFSSQAWSIGVEEQFYLLWPLLIKYLSRIWIALISIVMFLFILQNCTILGPKLFGNLIPHWILNDISIFFRFFRIDCMAIGSLGAYLFYTESRHLNFIYHRFVSLLVLIATIILILLPWKIYFIDNIIYSIIFISFILNVATNEKCVYSVENHVFNVLGDVSYGIYMYHPVICFTVIKLLGDQSDFLLYPLVFAFTISLALGSYYFFEKPFVDLKSRKFAIIKSNRP